MGMRTRLVLFVVLAAGIWVGDELAQRKWLEPGNAAAAVAAVNGDDAAARNVGLREQRQTALDGAAVAATFFVGILCFATMHRKPTRVVVDQRGQQA